MTEATDIRPTPSVGNEPNEAQVREQRLGRRRSWIVRVEGWPEAESVVFTESRSRAVKASWRSANDAGYKTAWTEFKAVRAPQYDALVGAVSPNRPYALDYVKTLTPPTEQYTTDNP